MLTIPDLERILHFGSLSLKSTNEPIAIGVRLSRGSCDTLSLIAFSLSMLQEQRSSHLTLKSRG